MNELPPDPREWLRSIMCAFLMAVGFVAVVLVVVGIAWFFGWEVRWQ